MKNRCETSVIRKYLEMRLYLEVRWSHFPKERTLLAEAVQELIPQFFPGIPYGVSHYGVYKHTNRNGFGAAHIELQMTRLGT